MPSIESLRTVAVDTTVSTYNCLNERLSRFSPLVIVVGTVAGTCFYLRVARVYRSSDRPLHLRIAGWLLRQARQLSYVKAKIDKELSSARQDILHSIHKDDPDRDFIKALPARGFDSDEVLALAKRYDSYSHANVAGGCVSGAVYTDRPEEHLDLLTKLYRMFAYSNPLHPDVFPGVRRMEAEVIRMVLNMYHAPEDGSGSLTTGGTESIFMACVAARNRAYAKGITEPTIVIGRTAHAAFDKAADWLGLRVRHVPVDEDNRLSVKHMRRAIDSSTALLVGSAPSFSTGCIDPIDEIAKLGVKYDIPVHVDACLGGFLVPFLEEAGFTPPFRFDFRVPGVTSISCDTHKYGYAPKGSSVVLYRSKELHHHQYFAITDWPGGIYATPTLSGSRAGASAAAAWATLLWTGRDEYVSRARAILTATRRMANLVKQVPGLELFGASDVSVVAMRSNQFNIFAVSDRLVKRGYSLNTLQNPDAIHVCLTMNHATDEAVDTFVAELRAVCAEVAALPDGGGKTGTAALYGLAAQIPDRSLVSEMTWVFLDACYAMPPLDSDGHESKEGQSAAK